MSLSFVKNSKAFASELSFLDLGSYDQFTGIQPQVRNVNDKLTEIPEFYSDNLKAGYIGNIFVN